MCDVYFEKCAYPECEIRMYLHLANFATGRDEIEVYCYKHIPEDISDGVLFEVDDFVDHEFPELNPGYFGKMFLRCLTQNARENWSGNDYNGTCKTIKIFGMNEEEEKAFLEEEDRKAKIWLDAMDEARKEGKLMEFLRQNRSGKRRVRNESAKSDD